MSYTPNQEKITINSSGDLSASSVTTTGVVSAGGNITTTGSGTVTLSNTGTIVASGDITAFSDLALKENVQPIQDALMKISSLTGVTYLKDGKQSVGLIAQNVESVIPEAIQKNEQFMSVAYGNLVGVLIEAIKELNEEVKRLKEQQ